MGGIDQFIIVLTTWLLLVGGLEHDFYFFHILGIVTPTDFHIFQRGWNHQPDYIWSHIRWINDYKILEYSMIKYY